ncbi:LLM class flavin-dependent oxidoreductase [Nocardia sp. NPDC057353]|uniref:LLM class flavin-dependent oxidoreductase n=1 Tax=Nocardia sp. NPDC057353 TaxID=3346104 RepID=UPI003636ECA5
MTVPVLLEIAVGDPVPLGAGAAPGLVPLAVAAELAAAAERAGVVALRVRAAAVGARDVADGFPRGDHVPANRGRGHRALDPSTVAAYLAGRTAELGYLLDLPTTGNAPYNAARRVLSVDRAVGGRAGVVLQPGAGDEVSDAAAPDPTANDPAERWAEYATVLTRLWESFPRAALLGDQERALVLDDALIGPIDFEGRYYRVAGPLDGPSSAQGRPVLAVEAASGVADLGLADAVFVERGAEVPPGRFAVIGRAEVAADTDLAELATWASGYDAVLLAPVGGADAVRDTIDRVVPALARREPHPTLRAALGLPVPTTEEIPA